MSKWIPVGLKWLLLPACFFMAMAQGAFSQTTEAVDLKAAGQAYAAGDYAGADRLYRAVLRNDPNSAKAYQGLGNCEYALGRKSEALSDYQESLQINPDNPRLSAFAQSLKAQMPAAQPASAPVKKPANRGPNRLEWDGPEYDISLGPAVGLGGVGLGIDETYYFINGQLFSLGVAANVYLFGLDSSTLTYCGEGLLQFRFAFGDGPVRPFVIGGGGFNAIYSTNAFSNSGSGTSFSFVSDPMVVAGGGVLFCFNRYLRLYLQGTASVVFLTGDNTTIVDGSWFQSASGGGTLTYYPIQLGLSLSI